METKQATSDKSKRLIDPDDFLKWVIKRFKCVPLVGSCDNDSESMKSLLAQAPTVDAAPVVHGRWVERDFGMAHECSECGHCELFLLTNYCPDCGAKMDEGKRNGLNPDIVIFDEPEVPPHG